MIAVAGELHQQEYTVTCKVSVTAEVTEGSASNRKAAEKIAAQAMLDVLKVS